jgi:hypothetical protein
MNTNKQHLNSVSTVTGSELVRVFVIGLLFSFFTYLLWQMVHSASLGAIALIRGLVPRVI